VQAYSDAYLTAHFEVPGEMFTLAMQAKARGMGVVGSTSNILDFIAGKVNAALQQPFSDRLTFVLGTEAGMITSIVRKVQALLQAAGRTDVEVEVVFPVNPSAISTPAQQLSPASSSSAVGPSSSSLPLGLAVLPGPAAGEGCSLEGGCASCPYMKMNSLDALLTVADRVGSPAGEAMLEGWKPKAYAEQVAGKSMAQAGCVPILHMRYFTQHKQFSPDLVNDIITRNQ
jgi:quinolinate synthase